MFVFEYLNIGVFLHYSCYVSFFVFVPFSYVVNSKSNWAPYHISLHANPWILFKWWVGCGSMKGWSKVLPRFMKT